MYTTKDEFVFFWKGPFSQWHRSDFIDEFNTSYFCAEQYMMYAKARLFNDSETAYKIMASTSPNEVKNLGRAVKNFDEEVWDKYKFSIIYKGNFLKFSQDLDLLTLLLNTGNKLLVEASPYDNVWGIGLAEDNSDIYNITKWKGQNLLGKALTAVRDYLRYNTFNKKGLI